MRKYLCRQLLNGVISFANMVLGESGSYDFDIKRLNYLPLHTTQDVSSTQVSKLVKEHGNNHFRTFSELRNFVVTK